MRSYLSINGAPILGFAAWLCILASALHVLCIWGGAAWYRALGAGEGMARAADRGSIVPHLIAAGIALIPFVWAIYAIAAANRFSGHGIQARLPFIRSVLCAITVVLLLRGAFIFVPDLWRPDLSADFKFYSSLAVLVMAAAFGFGTWQAWPALSPAKANSDTSLSHHSTEMDRTP